MVGLVHHDNRVQTGQRTDQGGIVGAFHIDRHAGRLLIVGQLHEGGVLLICLAALLVLERVVGQHEDGQLVVHGRDVETAAGKSLFLVEHFDPVGEVAVYGDAEVVGGITQLPDGLAQDLLARHKPHHGPCLHRRKIVIQHLERVRGDERLSAARGHFDAHLPALSRGPRNNYGPVPHRYGDRAGLDILHRLLDHYRWRNRRVWRSRARNPDTPLVFLSFP